MLGFCSASGSVSSHYYALTPCFISVLSVPLSLLCGFLLLLRALKIMYETTPPATTREAQRMSPIVGSDYLLLDDEEEEDVDESHDLAMLSAMRTPEAYEILCELASGDMVKEEGPGLRRFYSLLLSLSFVSKLLQAILEPSILAAPVDSSSLFLTAGISEAVAWGSAGVAGWLEEMKGRERGRRYPIRVRGG